MEIADRSSSVAREWVNWAVSTVEADANRSADTHLLPFPLPEHWGVQLYLKDESVHPTGSLKHRLARSLFLYGLCNGWIDKDTTIIEASSGSTAVSEAYFARMLGLPFVAVMPASTSAQKISVIEFYGGKAHLVDDGCAVVPTAQRLAAELGGHFMDQFTYAERATDWRGNNNIAESIFEQMSLEAHPIPEWIIVGAGTGGTSATIGRYLRYQRHNTKLCVVDSEHSAFFHGWKESNPEYTVEEPSRIEGIGRPRVEESFIPQLVDRMVKVPDADSIACVRWASKRMGRKLGGSTGTNLCAAFDLISHMRRQGRQGSVVTLLCDDGARYTHTYFDDDWVASQQMDLAPMYARLEELFAS
ncbi:PLP-dependent cysteine synthase family protein [Natronoglycomyces albus]|uniref:L-cysteine desulfhydrase Cds1 n=1 Tax=Natronoglycomyces albus TaxID=2811108 RepID=A0A895XQL6_9ACTN|nr:PLP-dependent cysteine synthase family protein [Natronoglycomyces albus]QSB05823.1 PLP-dependent cysteine synthase family protein [Natronoglycomyces albus]